MQRSIGCFRRFVCILWIGLLVLLGDDGSRLALIDGLRYAVEIVSEEVVMKRALYGACVVASFERRYHQVLFGNLVLVYQSSLLKTCCLLQA